MASCQSRIRSTAASWKITINLLQYGFPICGETSVRIAHQLITMPGTRFRDVRLAFSHPVALNQCRHFFEQNKSIEATTFYDTAGSVKMLREKQPAGAAAIASESAARIYGGVIVKRNIEDNPHNYTRFFLLTKQTPLHAWQPANRGKPPLFSPHQIRPVRCLKSWPASLYAI